MLIRTAYSGISAGTELNVYRGLAPQWRFQQDAQTGLFLRDAPEWSYPLVYGYANVGEVARLGDGVQGFSVGDLVFSYQPHCAWVVAAASEAVRLPHLPDIRRGVFVANLNTALNGVLDAHPAVGDVVVVSGLGVVGLLVTRLLRRSGPSLIVGIDTYDHRRKLALDAGADFVFAPTERVAERVRELTQNRGADVVVEVSGAAPALNEAIRIAGFGGLVVAMSWYGGTFETLSLSGEFHHNRIRVRSSQVDAVNPDLGSLWSTNRRMELALKYLQELPLEGYITNEFAPEAASDAYAMLDKAPEDAVQVIFKF
jgi:2-desacetyl-2-hydroxyethyl bacteriochlorophyllide A dehydrogenase